MTETGSRLEAGNLPIFTSLYCVARYRTLPQSAIDRMGKNNLFLRQIP
jgi:hypothetical protein